MYSSSSPSCVYFSDRLCLRRELLQFFERGFAMIYGRDNARDRRWPESIERTAAAAARRRLEEIVDAANVRSSSVSTPTRFTSDVITQTARAAGSTGMPSLPVGSLLVFSSSQSIYAGSRARSTPSRQSIFTLPSSRIFQHSDVKRGDRCAVGWRR